jgi:hypothetical protein
MACSYLTSAQFLWFDLFSIFNSIFAGCRLWDVWKSLLLPFGSAPNTTHYKSRSSTCSLLAHPDPNRGQLSWPRTVVPFDHRRPSISISRLNLYYQMTANRRGEHTGSNCWPKRPAKESIVPRASWVEILWAGWINLTCAGNEWQIVSNGCGSVLTSF